MQAGGATQNQDIPLPELREDLQIVRRDVNLFGAPAWILLDPLRNKFFTISFELFQLLSLWNANRTSQRLASSVSEHFGRTPSNAEIEDALMLLDESQLTANPAPGNWRMLHRHATARRWYSSAMHNYLFLKIPLARPQPFIEAIWPYVSFFLSRGMAITTLVVGLLGLYLASRQWDTFLNTFPYLFTLEGVTVSLLAVMFVKSVHECGHALCAHRYGCRIPTVGLAFMILVPRLYTDVTETWRLGSRRSRVAVDSAGVIAELYVAAFALFLWSFVPDGPARSALFVLATTSWLLSLLVNLNPFIRFDGYYILADLLGIDNLQPRAFAHFRWKLRRLLFNLDEAAPEMVPGRVSRVFTAYAAVTIVYRLILYIGIALLVYYFFIKAVGIILFMVEMAYFIVMPILSELRIWWSERAAIMRKRRTYVTLSIVVLLLVGISTPLSTTIRAPAVIVSALHTHFYAPEAGRLSWSDPRSQLPLRKGDELAMIESPELEHEIDLARMQLELAERRLARIGTNRSLRTERGVLEGERDKLHSQLLGLLKRKQQLTLRLPFDAEVIDIDPEMHNGRWVSTTEMIATVFSGSGWVVRGYVAEDDASRLSEGAEGVFVPTDISRPTLKVTVSGIGVTAVDRLEIAQLASVHGGAIAATKDARGNLVPNAAQHAVVATLQDTSSIYRQEVSGFLVMDGEPESILSRVWRQVTRVLIRELSA